ncbi:ATP-binding protein [Methylomonas sp. AM2-LC]|uniref:hybrid sensor histidine kinase/response regulator n=1 Tax=Methylomonas sp. AM2-LC TaxID=3153301 RepID=UPI003266014C
MFIDDEEKSTILVIDPNPILREQLDEIFNGNKEASLNQNADNCSYAILGCVSCRTAKEHVYEQLAAHRPFQLLFVESQLCDGDGLNLISDLWRMDADIHVVLCSADSQLNWQHIVETVGESDQLLFLQKPFSLLALRQIVHALLRKWQLNKQSHNVMKFMEKQIIERTEAIAEANRNLHQAEKLASIGQLAAGIAHEVNTPAQYVGDNINALGSVFDSLTKLIDFYRQQLQCLGNPELILEMQKREQREDLPFILDDTPLALQQSREGMEQISQIVQAMKGFSHVGAGTLSRVNINLCLENTLIIARSSYKYIADLHTEFGEIPYIECNAGELNQVFLNIIVNAAHAIEDSKKDHGLISVITRPTETGIEVRISDTGTGIPKHIHDRIYDPFFTTKVVGRGSGQGLNIAYRIIKQHRGSIHFETVSGEGTTFIVALHQHLPLVE